MISPMIGTGRSTMSLTAPRMIAKKLGRRDREGIGTMLFTIGDYVAGALMGALTAAIVHAVVSPRIDMVLAMLIGMGLGMVLHIAVTLAVAPLLGMFQTMAHTSIIGMYGGMLFAMRDSMPTVCSPSTWSAAWVGALVGLIVVAALRVYDSALRSNVIEAESAS